MRKSFFKKISFVFIFIFIFIFTLGKNITFAADPVTNENIIIRDGSNIIYSGIVPLPASGNITIPDNKGVTHSVNADSVLSVIYTLDQNNDSFSISDLSYSASYSSFLLNCLTPAGGTNLCFNWQYAIGNSYPSVGMDKYILSGGENIYLFFGPQNRVLLNSNNITTSDTLTVTSQKYDYVNNTWEKRPGVTVGLTTPNPSDPFSPNDDINKLVNSNTASATFSEIPTGTYNVGIKEDYYWPTVKLTVTTPPVVTGAGMGSSVTHFSGASNISSLISNTDETTKEISDSPVKKGTFSVPNALYFLLKNENEDGSFGPYMYTDWAAIAGGAAYNQTLISNISNYFKKNPLDSSLLTDNERHAMALMALNINPYTGTPTNYIQKIIDSFDGQQFGDKDLVNDDIFALIVLKNVGFNESNSMIVQDVKFIISRQDPSGSWGSVDLTAAAIQALDRLNDLPGAQKAISEAANYLLKKQNDDGSFGNSFSTSWALQGFFSSGNPNTLKPSSYLASLQGKDGGLEKGEDINSRILATSYAIPAILHKPWSLAMSNFPLSIFPDQTLKITTSISETPTIAKVITTPKTKETDLSVAKIIKPKINNNTTISVKSKTDSVVKGNSNTATKPKDDKYNLPIKRSIFYNLKATIISLWHRLGF